VVPESELVPQWEAAPKQELLWEEVRPTDCFPEQRPRPEPAREAVQILEPEPELVP
jgi:hypothetical protein